MKKLLILSTLLLCLTASPKTFSAEEKNQKMYRCIEFWPSGEAPDQKRYRHYKIEDNNVIIDENIHDKVVRNYFLNKSFDVANKSFLSADEFLEYLGNYELLNEPFSIFRSNNSNEVVKQIVPANKIKDALKGETNSEDIDDYDDYFDDDDEMYPEYAIVESNITLELWKNWLENNRKATYDLELYNTDTKGFDPFTTYSEEKEMKEEESKKIFEKDDYLFTREKIFKKDVISVEDEIFNKGVIFNKDVIFNRILEVFNEDEDDRILPNNVPCYILQMKNGKIDTTFFNMEFQRTRSYWHSMNEHIKDMKIAQDMKDISREVKKILGVQENDEPKMDNKQKQNTSPPETPIVPPPNPIEERNPSSSISQDNNSSTSSNEEPGNNSNISSNQEPDDNSSTSSRINYHIGAIFIIIGATLSSLIQKRKKSPKKKKSSNEENVENTI